MALFFIILVFMILIFLIAAIRDGVSLFGDWRHRHQDELKTVNGWDKFRNFGEENRK